MSKFDLHIIDDQIVYLVDLDQGMTITNNVEKIILFLKLNSNKLFSTGKSLKNYKILYKDTMSCIDEIVLDKKGNFENFHHLYSDALCSSCDALAKKYDTEPVDLKNIMFIDSLEIA